MAIYNNVSNQTQAIDAGIFLTRFYHVSEQMRSASDQFLQLANALPDKERAKHYRKLHKKMVRLRKQWNCIEHEREIALAPSPDIEAPETNEPRIG